MTTKTAARGGGPPSQPAQHASRPAAEPDWYSELIPVLNDADYERDIRLNTDKRDED